MKKLVIAVTALLALTGCANSDLNASDGSNSFDTTIPTDVPTDLSGASDYQPPPPGPLVFRITATSGVASSITYDEGDSNIEQATQQNLPWRVRFADPGSGFMQLSAQNGGDGSITCTIAQDGSVIDQHTATGPYAIASCSYNEGN